MDKVQSAAAFLETVGQGEGNFLLDMMQKEMGSDLIKFVNDYAKAFSEKVDDSENAAGSLMILGYLLRAYEELAGEVPRGMPS